MPNDPYHLSPNILPFDGEAYLYDSFFTVQEADYFYDTSYTIFPGTGHQNLV